MNQSELLQWGILNRAQTTDAAETLQPASSTPFESETTEPAAPLLLTAHSTITVTAEPRAVPEKMDSKWIDIILGRSDATRMKELLVEIASADLSTVLLALEELEGFVQSIDNANDLGPIGAWPVIVAALSKSFDCPEERNAALMHVLWVIGTALQNNPKAHDQFAKVDGLTLLIDLSLESTQCILKLLRCFSALLQHSEQNLHSFYTLKGFEKMAGYCQDPIVRERMFFVLKVLLQEFPVVALMLVQSGFVEELYKHKDGEVAEFLLIVCSVNASAVDTTLLAEMLNGTQ